jgi:hypothetical protein
VGKGHPVPTECTTEFSISALLTGLFFGPRARRSLAQLGPTCLPLAALLRVTPAYECEAVGKD